jgi:hypothetical protein
MATLARGLALVAVSGRVIDLWNQRDPVSRGRAVLIGVGLGGDWMMVAATAVDLAMTLSEACKMSTRVTQLIGLTTLSFGLVDLARHDTESGHWSLLAGLGVLLIGTMLSRLRSWRWSTRRLAMALVLAWALPMASILVGALLEDPSRWKWSMAVVERCRFAEVPTDDLERLAVWVREQTPANSRFIGPPGPKTFRLWSRRSVAFNRAGSPYHATGLADWADRFRQHVGLTGSNAEFAQAYLADRHTLEAGYSRMTDVQLARLARSQGADHVLTASNRETSGPHSLLVKLRVEGRYAVYRVGADASETQAPDLRKNLVGLPFQFKLND